MSEMICLFQLLLSLARSLFQEQMSLERLISTIISEAKDMLKCQRCTVYLLDLKAYNAVSFDFEWYSRRAVARNREIFRMFVKVVPFV